MPAVWPISRDIAVERWRRFFWATLCVVAKVPKLLVCRVCRSVNWIAVDFPTKGRNASQFVSICPILIHLFKVITFSSSDIKLHLCCYLCSSCQADKWNEEIKFATFLFWSLIPLRILNVLCRLRFHLNHLWNVCNTTNNDILAAWFNQVRTIRNDWYKRVIINDQNVVIDFICAMHVPIDISCQCVSVVHAEFLAQ